MSLLNNSPKNETNNYTCKVPVADSDSVCIINSEWYISEINLLVLHDNQAWSGKFRLTENDDTNDLIEQLSISRNTYLEESKKALTTHNGADNFIYTLKNDKFSWKKNVRKNMSVKFGSVDLLKVPIFEGFVKVLDNALHSNFTLYTKLQTSETQRRTLEKENSALSSKLNEIVGKKKEMEETLYCNFLHLLNEKKRRIKELKEKIMLTENNKDLLQNDESDHFGSDTEIDSEEEERLSVSKTFVEGSSLDTDNDLVSLPKRSPQKRSNENVAGPSRKSSKAKNSKVVNCKKPIVEEKGNRNRKRKDSCLTGQMSELNNKIPCGTSEDAFLFKKHHKKTINVSHTVKSSTSKIKYESDEETDLKNNEQVESDHDKTPSVIDQVDPDKTPSVIDQVENLSENIMNFEQNKSNEANRSDFKPVTAVESSLNSDDKMSGNPKELNTSSRVVKKSSSRGLSSTALSALNDLLD